MFVRSSTVHLHDDLLRTTFQQRPEFVAWGLKLSPTPERAEILVEIARPLFTFDWTYKVTGHASDKVLLSGKVVAWDGKSAAPKIAASILELMAVSRPALAIPAKSPGSGRLKGASRSWPVSDVEIGFEFLQGIPFTNGNKGLRLNLNDDNVTITSTSGTIAKISLLAIVAISYDNEVTSTGPADAYWKFWNNSLRWDSEGAAALVIWPVILAGSIVPELEKERVHHVSILYRSKEEKIERLRCAALKDHEKLLSVLRDATGVESTDLSRFARELKKGPEAGLLRQGDLILDRELLFGKTVLPPGTYSVMLRRAKPPQGEVYLLAGTGSDIPVIRADVELLGFPRGGNGIANASYELRPGTNSISEIHFDGQIMRIETRK